MASLWVILLVVFAYYHLDLEPVSHVVARPSPNDILEWRKSFSRLFYLIMYWRVVKEQLLQSIAYEPSPLINCYNLVKSKMDNSPTTGSVNTTVVEKQRLAKASLAFNCKNPTFRKLFPEYVEKYEQQQLSEQPVPEQLPSVPTQEDNSRNLLEKRGNLMREEPNRVEAPIDMNNQKRKSFPTWVLLLLVSIFGILMALPLLQL
ncbi:unnamed protein product [Ilex paraguariensis]|uniref:Uncharacterized protein n=1 Tax=Ilex paraguariensis TaxID=185542 RepID=A0ABC8RI99_9AQUA